MRSKTAPKRPFITDTMYNSNLVAKIINKSMMDGKKSVAAKHVYKAIDIISEKTGQDGLTYLNEAVENVKPTTETRSRRVGGANYQVPCPIRPDRRDSLAIRWILNAVKARGNNPLRTFSEKLAAEIMEAHENQGASVKKKLDVHKMAEANKAFAHFRW